MTDVNPYEEGLAMELARAEARIEELEAACWRMKEERARAIAWRDSDMDRADEAEAKLELATDALEEIIETPARRYQRNIARRAIAEIKGQDNE